MRKEPRLEARGRAIDAAETDWAIAPLEQGGVLRLAAVVKGTKGGGTKRRWAVKLALRT